MSESEQNGPQTEESFEVAIARLEAIAERLENPDTPLEEAVGLFEEGVALARLCADRLEAAELRITELRPDDGGPDGGTSPG